MLSYHWHLEFLTEPKRQAKTSFYTRRQLNRLSQPESEFLSFEYMTRNQAGVTASLPGDSSSRFLIPANTFFAQGVRAIGCPPLSCCTEDIR